MPAVKKRDSWFRNVGGGLCVQNLGRLIVIAVLFLLMIYLTKFIPSEPVGQTFFFGLYVVFAYLLWNYSAQTVSEFWLFVAIFLVYHGIDARNAGKKLTKTRLLSRYDSVRQNMILFLVRSGSQLSPVSDILLEKLKQSVDTFFYATELTVFSEKPDYYSASEEYQAKLEEEARDLEAEMAEEAAQGAEDEYTGHVSYFHLQEVKSFLIYLGDRVFRKSGFHPFWVYKYRINLTDYLNFFEHWNDMLLTSDNGRIAANRARTEVREFYDENRRRLQIRTERVWFLILNLLVALLSAVIGFVFGRLGFR